MAESSIETPGAWAQPLTLAPGQTLRNELAGLRLWVTLLEREWQVRFERTNGTGEAREWRQSVSFVVPGSETHLTRYVRRDDADTLRLMPALADLSMVIRPYHPFYIPAESDCTIFLSTPTWMRILVSERNDQLLELPVTVPSMTWVGKTTMDGELCYASNTFARLNIEAVHKLPWRAITPARIVNRRKDSLLLERFSLPTTLLSLYQSDSGQLWTPEVTVTCEKDMAEAKLSIGARTPSAAGHCKRLSPARQEPGKGGLVKALDRLFG